MGLQGKDGGTYKNAAAVYGKSGGSWLYAKEVFAKNASGWQRAWTDCRLYDAAGGRDWSAPVDVVTYSGACGNRTQITTTTRTKTGCPNDVRAVTVSSPDCNKYDTNCYNAATGAYEYRSSCASRESRIVYTFTAKSNTACDTQYAYTDWTASPDCTGACRTAKTGDFSEGGISYIYSGPAGEYVAYPNPFCSNGCDWSAVYFTVLTCGGTNYITETFRDVCRNIFGDPC